MGDYRRARCRRCGKHRSVVGEISWLGNCLSCGEKRLAENITGLATHSGEPLARWRRGMAACVGGVLLDDVPPDVQTEPRA